MTDHQAEDRKRRRAAYKRAWASWNRRILRARRLGLPAPLRPEALEGVDYGNDAWRALTKLDNEWREKRVDCPKCGDRHILP